VRRRELSRTARGYLPKAAREVVAARKALGKANRRLRAAKERERQAFFAVLRATARLIKAEG